MAQEGRGTARVVVSGAAAGMGDADVGEASGCTTGTGVCVVSKRLLPVRAGTQNKKTDENKTNDNNSSHSKTMAGTI
jgi:hypothetical protein